MALEPGVAKGSAESCQNSAGGKNEQEPKGAEDGMSNGDLVRWAQACDNGRGSGAGRGDRFG